MELLSLLMKVELNFLISISAVFFSWYFSKCPLGVCILTNAFWPRVWSHDDGLCARDSILESLWTSAQIIVAPKWLWLLFKRW